jgi:hypothetical protein
MKSELVWSSSGFTIEDCRNFDGAGVEGVAAEAAARRGLSVVSGVEAGLGEGWMRGIGFP